MNEILEKIRKTAIVPVVLLEDAKDAKPLARALCDGGLPCAEVTFRTEAAEEGIRVMADRAIAAGARFIVSPGLNPRVVKHCLEKGITMLPGTATPSDVERAMEFGLDAVKFFPAEAAGGLAMIRAMAAPYTNMKFMPTGGINEKNLRSYLDFPRVLACGGSWMVKGELIRAGKFDEIRELTRKAVELAGR